MESQLVQMNYIQYWTNELCKNHSYIIKLNENINQRFEEIKLQYSNVCQIYNSNAQISNSLQIPLAFPSSSNNPTNNNTISQSQSQNLNGFNQFSGANPVLPYLENNNNINMSSSRARLIQKYYELKKDKTRKSKFISLYKSKEKMHRIDCMTRKINASYYQFLVENSEKYHIDKNALDELKNNLRFTSKQKFLLVNTKYPFLKGLYEVFLDSYLFSQLILAVKCKYDKEYLKLFYNHAHNFIWLNETVNSNKDE